MDQKKYMDIERFKISFTDGFLPGDHIVVQEKIDGANFSICYDSQNEKVVAFSRKKPLDEVNNLRGAYEWSQTKEVLTAAKHFLKEGVVLFGEWLVPHTVKYPESRYKNAYFYDAYDTNEKCYLPQDEVAFLVHSMGLIYVPVFYDGPFISWDHLASYVGQTKLGGEMGEGIVIKNQSRLNDPNTKLPFYTKIVSQKFSEVHDSKPHEVDPEKLAEKMKNQAIAETIVTSARIRKIILKMVDEGILREDWDAHDMGIIAKNLGKRVYEDCLKEEPDTVALVEGFGKMAASIAMKIVKLELLNER